MQIVNSKKFFLLIFSIILCIYPLYTKAEIRTFTHIEEKDDYLPKLPRMQRLKVYDDGTAVARIVRTKTAVPPKVCFFEIFSLRIIYLNGTVDENEINLDIPPINYCFFIVNGFPVRFLDYYLIRKNQILITYVNTTNPDDFTTYEDWGMIINFNGKEYDRTFFGLRYIDMDTLQLMPNTDPRVILNINREKGILRLYSVRGEPRQQEWQQYKIESDGTFTKLTDGEVPFFSNTLSGQLKNAFSTAMSTVDEGFTIFFGYTIDNFIPTNLLLPQGQFSVLPIGYNQTATSPSIFYQSPLPNLEFAGVSCGIAFAGVGHTCVLTASQFDAAGAIKANFLVKIDFLSSGSVTDFTVINAPTVLLVREWGVKSLQFGGFLFTNIVSPTNPKRPSRDIFGYLNSGGANDNTFEWEFSEPTPGNTEAIFEVLPNNTLLVPQFEDGNSWQIKAIDLPKFAGDRDKGYANLNVEATVPAIDEIISPNIPLKISITFYRPVKLSNGKLSIYQVVDDQQYLLRQSIPSIKCSIENGGRTVSADVLVSTFSVSKGNYSIVMDNKFVRETDYNEPLLGIRENIWRVMTKEKKDIFAPRTNGLFRLTSLGTQAFDNLSQDERHDFFVTLLEELSFAIPVDLERLTTSRMTQLDNSLHKKRYLISIDILAARDEYDNNVASIIKIIDTMIKNQDQSPIGFGRIAGYLDESYGFKELPNLWEKCRIGLFLIVGLWTVLFIIAQIRSSEGNNLAIIQLFLIIFDLLTNTLFVSNNADTIPVLYIPSIIFFTTQIAINMILVFYIITQENIKPKFYQWFIKNGNIASLFIVLAVVDIKVLNILQSNLAGFQSFKAPFSNSAQSKIFWTTFLNIFIKDIPQVIIQAYYRRNTVYYEIIPLLVLISSAVNLTINIVYTLYQATYRVAIPEYVSINLDDKDDFFGDITSFTTLEEK